MSIIDVNLSEPLKTIRLNLLKKSNDETFFSPNSTCLSVIKNSIISIDNRYFKGQNCMNIKWKFHLKIFKFSSSSSSFFSFPFALPRNNFAFCFASTRQPLFLPFLYATSSLSKQNLHLLFFQMTRTFDRFDSMVMSLRLGGELFVHRIKIE